MRDFILFSIDMNYVSAIYAIVVIIIVIDWYARGRREYRGQSTRHEQVVHVVEDVARRGDSVVR